MPVNATREKIDGGQLAIVQARLEAIRTQDDKYLVSYSSLRCNQYGP